VWVNEVSCRLSLTLFWSASVLANELRNTTYLARRRRIERLVSADEPGGSGGGNGGNGGNGNGSGGRRQQRVVYVVICDETLSRVLYQEGIYVTK